MSEWTRATTGHFFDACGETLNHVINTVADVLHIPYTEAHHERRGDLDDGQITAADAVIAPPCCARRVQL